MGSVIARPHDQAARVRELASAELRDHKIPGTIALYMQLALAWPELMYGDFETAERYAAEHVAFCVEKRVEQFRLWGGNYQASARAMRESTEENVAALRVAIAANNRSGGYFLQNSIFKSYLAEALLMRRDISWRGSRASGRLRIRRSDPASGSGSPILPPCRWSDRAQAPWRLTESAPEACFLRAIEKSPTGKKPACSELRAATELAELWRR